MDIPFFKNAPSLGFSLFDKKSSILGIDIGNSSIKLVQLRIEKEKAVLETYGELATGPYAHKGVGQAARLADPKVAEVIKDLVRETGSTAKSVVASIPLRNSFITIVEVPTSDLKELETIMQYEMRRYIPIPLSEVIVDWWHLPEDHHVGDGTLATSAKKSNMSVLLVAVPKEIVERHKRILQDTGLDIAAFEIETFSSVRSIVGRESQTILVVDFGAVTAKMAIVERGMVRASHSFEKGFQDISMALVESLGLDFTRAENIKRETGLSARMEHEGVLKVILPIIDYIQIEIERFAVGYTKRYGGSISKIYISGGGASMPGLVDYMVKKFGVEVLLANPFSKVDYPAFFQPVLKEIGPSFSIATGLALRGLQ